MKSRSEKMVALNPEIEFSRMGAVDRALLATCMHFGLRLSDLKSEAKLRYLAHPRQCAMVVLREYIGLSYPQIARALRRKNHTTVIHGVKSVRARARPGEMAAIHEIAKRAKLERARDDG